MESGGPGGRIGHSMVLGGNDSRVIMFGGRDNEIVRQHIPKTYEVRHFPTVDVSVSSSCVDVFTLIAVGHDNLSWR